MRMTVRKVLNLLQVLSKHGILQIWLANLVSRWEFFLKGHWRNTNKLKENKHGTDQGRRRTSRWQLSLESLAVPNF